MTMGRGREREILSELLSSVFLMSGTLFLN